MVSFHSKHTVLLSALFSIKNKWAGSWNNLRCALYDSCKIGKKLAKQLWFDSKSPLSLFFTKQVCLQQRPAPNDIETQKLTTTTTQRSTELAAGGNFSLWLYQVTAISSQVPPSSPVVCTEVTEPSLCSVILLLCLLCSCTGNFPSAVSRFHSARTFCNLLTGFLLWVNSDVLLKWCLSAAASFGWHGLGVQMTLETVFHSAFNRILLLCTFFSFSRRLFVI